MAGVGWPCLYGPSHNSISPETGVRLDFDSKGPPKIWERPTGKGYSAPVVFDKKLVLLSRTGDSEFIQCFECETGKELWDFSYPTQYKCTFEYSDGPYATPVIGNGLVVCASAEGVFHCLDLETGKLKWRRELLKEYQVALKEWPVTTSPILVGEKVLFNLGAVDRKAGVVGLDLMSGKTLWESTEKDYSHASPTVAKIHGKTFAFVMVDEGLVCMNPSNGDVYWEVDHRLRDVDRYNAVTPVVDGNRVSFVTGPHIKPGFRSFEILADGSYKEPWKNIRLLNTQHTNLVSVSGYLFGFTPVKQGGPELICINLENGKHAWKAKPNIGRGLLLGIEDRLLALGERGVLACFELNGQEGKELWRTDAPILKGPCYTSMALSDGLLFARDEEKIVCLSLRKTGQ